MLKVLSVAFVVVLGLLAWALHPVCVPLSAQDLRGFNVPIEQRADRNMHLQVFQRGTGSGTSARHGCPASFSSRSWGGHDG